MSDDDVDLVELSAKAELLAEATGRDKSDVLADLLDDGEMNYSAGTDKKDDKGILDKANEQAEKAKTLLMTLMPVIAIIVGGGGAEILGITDFSSMGDDDDSNDYEIPNIVYWGCTDYNAQNYDQFATDDDGSCYYEQERSLDVGTVHLSLPSDRELKVEVNFYLEGDWCCDDPDLRWRLFLNGEEQPEMERWTYPSYDERGHHDFTEYWNDVESGTWEAKVSALYDDELWDEETSNTVMVDEPEPIEGCTDSEATNYDENADTDDGSCEYPEPECELNATFYATQINWNITNESTSMIIRWDADLTCDTTHYIEVDIYISNESNEQVFSGFTGYNTTFQDSDWKTFTWDGAIANHTYDIRLDIWLDTGEDGWVNSDTKIHEDEKAE
jgi:hypothetical protein